MKEGRKGILITFEGIDGAGKSTIVSRLSKSGPLKDAVFTREPSRDTLTGKAVYDAIASDTDPLAELFLFIADHAAHLADVVRPALADGKVVISDRYSDSRCAYQGATLEKIVPDALDFVGRVHEPWTEKPDLTFIFDLEPEISVARCGDRGEMTKFEKTEFLKAVRNNFGILAAEEPDRFTVIDASLSADDIEKIVLEKIESFLRDRKNPKTAVTEG